MPHLSASGLWRSFWRNNLHSTVFLSPPGVCLWSPAQMFRQGRGVRAMTDVSSMFPYCWLSSVSVKATSVIHQATGEYDCEHSCWKPPPQPMSSFFWRKTSCLFSQVTSSKVLLVFEFRVAYQPPNFGCDTGW